MNDARPTRTSRRGALATLLAMGMWPGARAAERVAGPVRFVAFNDPHHEDAGCDAWMEALFRQISMTRDAAMCFALGDLANTGKIESLRAIRRLSAHAGMPFYPCPGNHDLDESPVEGYYEEVFPGMRNYRIDEGGWVFLVLDSTEGAKFRDTRIGGHTLDWLDAVLPEIDARAPVVVLTHFPLAAGVKYCPLNAEEVLSRFVRHNLRGVFGGHFHGRTRNVRGAVELRTCACVSRVRRNHDRTSEKGYLVVDGDPGGGLRSEFVAFHGV